MSKTDVKIVEAFGKFIVELENGAEMFSTEAEAQTALIEYEQGAAHRDLAAGFCAYVGIEADSKNAKSKANIITAYLSWVEAGQPAPAPKEETAPDAPAAASGDDKEPEF